MYRGQTGGYTVNTPTVRNDFDGEYKCQQAAREQMEPTLKGYEPESLAEVVARIYDAVHESERLTLLIDVALYGNGNTPCDGSEPPQPHSIDSAARIIYSQLCQHNDELRSILNRLGG